MTIIKNFHIITLMAVEIFQIKSHKEKKMEGTASTNETP